MRDRLLLLDRLAFGPRLDGRFFALLEAIQQTGSLRKAAAAAGYSYKGAWAVLDAAGRRVRRPLVEAPRDGGAARGTRLSDDARHLLGAYRTLSARLDDFLQLQEEWLLAQPDIAPLLKAISMKTTARNQLSGTITDVSIGPVSAQAVLTTPSGLEITATMTSAAARKLGLAHGQAAIALVKASAVVLVTDFGGYALSARNQFAGTVSRVQRGAVSTLVGLTLPGGVGIAASVTNDAVDALGLAVGLPATAVFKAYSVMLAVAKA